MRSQTLLEGLSAVFLPVMIVYYMRSYGHEPGPATALGLIAVALFLIEGALVWWIKWRAIRHLQVPTAASYARMHDWVVRFNQIVLAVTGAGIAWLLSTPPSPRPVDHWVGAGAWLFALAEHVNYFHWQLMHQKLADFRWLARHRRCKRGVAWRLRHGGGADG